MTGRKPKWEGTLDIDEMARRIGARFSTWRRITGYTINESAELMKLLPHHLMAVETGDRHPSWAMVIRMLDITGMTPNEMFSSPEDLSPTADARTLVIQAVDSLSQLSVCVRRLHDIIQRSNVDE